MASPLCNICEAFLLETTKDLGKKFSTSLRTRGQHDEDEEERQAEDNDPDDDVEEEEADYYSSTDFIDHLSAELEGLPSAATRPKFRSAVHQARQTDHDYA